MKVLLAADIYTQVYTNDAVDISKTELSFCTIVC